MRSFLCILLLCCCQISWGQEKDSIKAVSADSQHPTLNSQLSTDSLNSQLPPDSLNSQLTPDSLNSQLPSDSVQSKYSKWVPLLEEEKKELPLFQGFTVSFDVIGIGMLAMTDYGTIEGALRLSLKNTWLPIVELGYGICDRKDYNTKIQYKVNAPFIRLGCDWNFLRNKFQDNRMFVGLRWGFSTYKYDMTGPPVTDPIYGESQAFDFSGSTSTSNWMEIVFGCQVKIYRNFHMGWSLRLKYHIASSKNDYSKAYYIPGYGVTTSGNTWAGTYNLIFDLNWGKKKKVTVEP